MLEQHTLTFEFGSLTLNDQQYEIVQAPLNQHLRVLASAGSGKTTTITAKIAHALTHQSIKPDEVVLTTFSRSGADTMRDRLEKLVGSTTAYIGTFHALALQILRQHDPAAIEGMYTVDELPHLWLDFLNTEKGKRWASKIKMLVVDEFQDINDIQLDIIRAILAKSQSFVIIVGDDAQNIYAWRGSRVDYILNMHEEIKTIQDFQLTYNYRSSESIVAVANSLMRKIPTLSHKERMTSVPMGLPEVKPEVRYFHRFAGEVAWIVRDIEARIDTSVDGKSRPTIAILSKYNNVLFQFEEAFVQRQLTCRLITEEKVNKRKRQADVVLSTFHAAKGLEWDVVYIVKLHDATFPQMKHEEGIDEERRLFYVAATRARSVLIMTYSKGEKNMCRFLREIHRPLLRWHSVVPHSSIEEEVAVERSDIESFFMSWTGEDFRRLKLNPLALPPRLLSKAGDGIQYRNYYPAGEQYTVPDWVFRLDSVNDFAVFVRYYILREIGLKFPESAGEWDDKVRLALFRIRILKEDLPTFEKEQELIQKCFEALFPSRLGVGAEAPPVFEFPVLQQKIMELSPGRQWTNEEMIPVMQILHKIRSTIYNLRHVESDLEEFLLGPAKGSPPMIMRNDLITSWRRVTNRAVASADVIYDLYRLACIYSSRLGRNAPLYKIPEPAELAEVAPFLKKAAANVLEDIHLLKTQGIEARVVLKDPQLDLTCEVDLLAGNTMYMFVEGDSRAETQRLDRWIEGLARVSIARKNGYDIKNVCYIQPLSGIHASFSLEEWSDTEFRQYLAAKVLL